MHKKKNKKKVGLSTYFMRKTMEEITDEQIAHLLHERGFFIEIKPESEKKIDEDLIVKNTNKERSKFIGIADELLMNK